MNSQKEFVQTLTDTIRHRGAMDLLTSNWGEAKISNWVKDILQMYAIEDFQSEPHQKNQNFFERWWQVIKRFSFYFTSCPSNTVRKNEGLKKHVVSWKSKTTMTPSLILDTIKMSM